MNDTKRPGWLREEMPGVAAIVDEFREAFGAETINAGIARLIQAGEFHCEDFTTGKSFGVAQEPRGVPYKPYRSPNGLPSMLDVKWSPSGTFCEFEGKRYSSDAFYALCTDRMREFRKGRR